MATNAGTLELLARELAEALRPLEQRLAAGEAEAFVAELGLRLPAGLAGQAQIATAFAATAVSAGGLAPLILQLTTAIQADDATAITSTGVTLLRKLRDVLETVSQAGTTLRGAAAAAGGLTPAQRAELEALAQEFPGRLFAFLLLEYLGSKGRGVLPTLALTGVVDDEVVHGDPANSIAPPYRRRTLHLNRLLDVVLAPARYLRDAFGWGAATFNGLLLFRRLKDFLEATDLPVTLIMPPGGPPVLEAYMFRLSTDQTTNPPTLTVRLRIPATQDFNRTYPLGGPWSLLLSAKARFESGLEAHVTPPLQASLRPPTGSVSLDLRGGFLAERAGQAVTLFGQSGGTRLEVRRLALIAGLLASFDSGTGAASGEPAATLEVAGGKILIDLSSGDGFVRTITGGVKLESNLDVKALWSPADGLRLEGSAAIEIAVPTHTSVGPIQIDTIYLRAGLAGDGSLPIELSSAFAANLGPLKLAVDRIGLLVITTFPPSGGNLGPANVALAFKPPNGVGIAVDAGVVKGGGFLYIDAERGEYAGALELVFSGFLTLKAIGIITTRMPDGSPGFSLLIIITAEFGTGIQLGFGFTLLAVGGLLGLNRTMRLDALVEGVRTGAVNSIMFPRDVVANAPRIISDLRAIFPPEQGKFLIGPMVKLGWGTPTLVSLSLGVIIEIPGNVAIVGVLRLALPADDIAIVVLQVNFVGAIEFDRKRLYFFAALFESRVLFMTIEGEMGVLAAFGDDANFVLSVGGFHPQFDPPPLPFPIPRRVSIDILRTPVARIRVEGYFGVTSNSAQFGARAEAYFGFSALSVEGHIAFDALLQFSPFYFIVEISASFSVKVFGLGVYGVRIRLALEGPTPWRARGSAGLSFFFFDIDIDIDHTWGEQRDTTLPPIAVMPLLKAELEKPSNWRALLPTGANLLVALRRLDADEAGLVLHPVGTLRVSQKAVPLDLPLAKVGNQRPADAKRFALSVTSGGLAKRADVSELFAPAQFEELDDAAKLSRPAYEPEHGGVELSVQGEQLASGPTVKRVVRYDVIRIDTNARRRRERFLLVAAGLFSHFLKGASIVDSSLSTYTKQQLDPFPEKVVTHPESYVVAFQSTNKAFTDGPVSFASEAGARDYLQQQGARDPVLAGALHVIPAYEVVA